MKYKKALASLLFLASMNLFPKFYSIKSKRELDRKLADYTYSFVCFAQDNPDGLRSKEMMKMVANSDDFRNLADFTFVVLFVHIDREALHTVAHAYAYSGRPLFMLLNHDRIITHSDLAGHCSVEIMKQFVFRSIGNVLHRNILRNNSLREDIDQDAICEDGYDAEDEYEKRHSREEMILAGYQPIDLVEKQQEYWWNRGSGNMDYGRGGWKYRNYFPETHKRRDGRVS